MQPQDPRRDLSSLRDSMNRFFNDSFWDPFELRPALRELSQRAGLYPKVDIEEDEKTVTVKANVPGLDPSQIEVNVEEDTLTLSGTIDHKEDRSEEEKQYYHYEREYGEFRRDIPLPAHIDPSQTKAVNKDGVLTVTLPKVAQDTRKRIEVENQG